MTIVVVRPGEKLGLVPLLFPALFARVPFLGIVDLCHSLRSTKTLPSNRRTVSGRLRTNRCVRCFLAMGAETEEVLYFHECMEGRNCGLTENRGTQ